MNYNISVDNISEVMQKSITLDTLSFILENVIPNLILTCFILGLIGFIGNAFTFLQPDLRSNPCCIYTLCSSLIDIIHLAVNILPDYLQTKYSIRLPWTFSIVLCKLYYFLYSFLPQLSINFLLLSIVDRYASTCSLTSRTHRLNQLKMVPRLIILMIVISGLLSIYAPVFSTNEPLLCGYREQKVYGILNVLISGILQPCVMLIFVLLAYRNIRRSRQRVGTVTGHGLVRFRNQFVVMIITQVLVTAAFSLQWMVAQSYVLYNVDMVKTLDELLMLTALFTLSNRIYPFNNVKSFYFSMLTSKSYRRTFIKGWKRILPRQ